jgi:2-phosphoglycerate kinase
MGVKNPYGITVREDKKAIPFSRGILASSVSEIGFDTFEAYKIADRVLKSLQGENIREVESSHIRRLVSKEIEKIDRRAAERYVFSRKQREGSAREETIILIGGASGVGTTTTGYEIASRLNIKNIVSTDTIREIMRMMISQKLSPELHMSTFNASEKSAVPIPEEYDPAVFGFERQASLVSVGIEAVINRALKEGHDIIVEGVHVVPGFISEEIIRRERTFGFLLSIEDAQTHRNRFKVVIFHNHLFPIPGAGRERNIIYNSGDVIEMLQNYDVHVVLNGHKHTPNVAQLNDIVVINSGTFSSYKTRQGEDHSFNVIDISPDRKEVVVTTRWMESGREDVEKRNFGTGTHTQADTKNPVFTIAQMSDLHVSDGMDFLPDMLEKAIDRINEIQPDQICICGNVVDRGLPHEYEIARSYLERLESPLLVVPGYNDLQHTGKFLFPKMVGALESRIDRGAVHFIGINTALPDTETGVIGRGKLNSILSSWPRQEMVNIAVQHHKLTPAPGIREHGYIEDAGSSLKKFIDSDTDIVLSGHRHISFSFMIDGLITVNSGTVSSRNHYTLFGNSFNLLTFFQDGGLIVEEYRLSEGKAFVLTQYRLPRWPRFPQ